MVSFIYWLVDQHYHIWVPQEPSDICYQDLKTLAFNSPIGLEFHLVSSQLASVHQILFLKNSGCGLGPCITLSTVNTDTKDLLSFSANFPTFFCNPFTPWSSKGPNASLAFFLFWLDLNKCLLFVMILLAIYSSHCPFACLLINFYLHFEVMSRKCSVSKMVLGYTIWTKCTKWTILYRRTQSKCLPVQWNMINIFRIADVDW